MINEEKMVKRILSLNYDLEEYLKSADKKDDMYYIADILHLIINAKTEALVKIQSKHRKD